MNRIRIGTRGSALALWQADHVAALLRSTFPTLEPELIRVSTKGDRILDAPLSKIGGKGLFTKELEAQLLNGAIDLAVHSLKDVPVELPTDFELAAITQRDDPLDAFVSTRFRSLEELPRGARVGTSSLRRRAQLLSIRPDLIVADLRGNVDTRLRKLDAGEFDAIILAAAGLKRLGYSNRIRELIAPTLMLPAVGQGALAIEIVRNNSSLHSIVSSLDDPITHSAVAAERSFLRVVEGGCQVPVGVFARPVDNKITVDGVIASLDGDRIIRDRLDGELGDIESMTKLGEQLAARMLDAGGRDILETLTRCD